VSTSTSFLPIVDVPGQDKIKAIKSQQMKLSRERRRMIQGMQERTDHNSNSDVVRKGFGANDVGETAAGTVVMLSGTVPSARIRYGPSTSFCEVGKQLAELFTLNERQNIAFRLLCRQLGRLKRAQRGLPQLCQFVGGEGGTGQSQIIDALLELFASKGISHRFTGNSNRWRCSCRDQRHYDSFSMQFSQRYFSVCFP
jgi:hypothetical protein